MLRGSGSAQRANPPFFLFLQRGNSDLGRKDAESGSAERETRHLLRESVHVCVSWRRYPSEWSQTLTWKSKDKTTKTPIDMTLPLTLKEVRGQTLELPWLHGCFKFYIGVKVGIGWGLCVSVCVCAVPRAILSTLIILMMVGLMGREALLSISSRVIPITDSSTMARSNWFHLHTHTDF